MSRISIGNMTSSDAHEFWLRSPQATVFNQPQVADRLAHAVRWWEARKGSETLLVWPVATDEWGSPYLPLLTYYFGPMWAPASLSRSASRHFVDKTAVYSSCIQALIESHGSVAAELHPSLLDVRAFDWWHYGHPQSERFLISPRYSARICELDKRSMSQVRAAFRSVRRREIEAAIRRGEYEIEVRKTCTALDIDVMGPWYLGLLGSLSEGQRTTCLRAIRAVGDVINEGWGFHLSCRHRETGDVVGVALVLVAQGTANLVLSVSSPSHRTRGVPQLLNYSAIETSKSVGMSNFDFNGANSPHRGEDKHTYGAGEVLYFRLQLK